MAPLRNPALPSRRRLPTILDKEMGLADAASPVATATHAEDIERRVAALLSLDGFGAAAHRPVLDFLIGILLASPIPAFIVWGSDRRTLYNAAFASLLGSRHPGALGSPAVAWWAQAEPLLAPPFAGDASSSFSLALSATPMAFVCSPIRVSDATVAGVFAQAAHTETARDAHAIEHALAQSRAQSAQQQRLYEAILTNTPDLAYVFDLQHRFVYANEGLLRMWGRSAADAIGKTCLELGYEPWHAAMHDEEIERVVATRQSVRGEVPFNGAFGRRMYDYILVPVFNADGEVEAVAGTTRDITDQKNNEETLRHLAEELARSDQRKTEFLAMLAHELRNPLAPISSAVHLIQNARGNQDLVASAAAVMQRQLGHMVRLVNDLMDISRITSGNIELRRERIALRSVIEHALETCRPVMEGAGHRLTVEFPATSVFVDADPVRLSQVVCNLLNNASKYSGEGSPISLCASCEGAEAMIVVRDQGIGIPASKLDAIFEMFTQLDASVEKTRSGLGVGLALVKTLVALHGGRVRAVSEGVGRGSEFTVWLPLASDGGGAG